MGFQVHSIMVGSHEPAALAAFWARMLDLNLVEEGGCWHVELPPHPTRMTFHLAHSEGSGDLGMEFIALPGEPLRRQVDELVARGAIVVLDGLGPYAGWAKLTDPEGNHFFVRASHEEVAEALARVDGITEDQ